MTKGSRQHEQGAAWTPDAPVELHGIAHGGEAVGRLADGRAVFVAGALPGEAVRVEVVRSAKRWARARLREVVRASPDRVAPPCPYYGTCGGCQLQHAAPAAQAALKRRVVVEQLAHLGGALGAVGVAETVRPEAGWPDGYRTTARFGVARGGQLGFRRTGSHEVVAIDRCLLLDPATQAAREAAGDDWAGADEVTIRTGDGGAATRVVRRGQRAEAEGPAALTVSVGGIPLRVSATSFFQPGPAGAAALVREVRAAAAFVPGDRVLDLYGGVGPFARALAADGAAVTLVESHPPAAEDARANLAGLGATVLAEPVDRALPRLAATHRTVQVVVLDPPRSGAGPEVTTAVAGLAPRTIVYVACDIAVLARDARTLAEAGYRLERVVPVDQFGHTAQIEAVATFRR